MNNPYLASLKPIWQNPRFVFVDEKRLIEIAGQWAKEDLKIPAWRFPNVQVEDDKDWMNFVILINALNFAYTNFKKPYKKFCVEYPKGEFQEGAFALEASIIRALKEGLPMFNADFLETINFKTVKHIFRGPIPIPLIEDRLCVLHETGMALNRFFDGQFKNIFKMANQRCFNKGKGLVEILIDYFPSFRDVNYYSYFPVHILQFHKRAQLAAIMYQGRAFSSNGRLPLLKDIERVGPPADYEVPKSLKYLGILKYKKSLEEKIQQRKIIPADSLLEQEIRAQMTYAMVRLIEEINKCRPTDKQVSILEVDFKAWLMGRNSPEYHHLTPTRAY